VFIQSAKCFLDKVFHYPQIIFSNLKTDHFL
jgi:hypothetical protein